MLTVSERTVIENAPHLPTVQTEGSFHRPTRKLVVTTGLEEFVFCGSVDWSALRRLARQKTTDADFVQAAEHLISDATSPVCLTVESLLYKVLVNDGIYRMIVAKGVHVSDKRARVAVITGEFRGGSS